MLFLQYKEMLKINNFNIYEENLTQFFTCVDLYDNNQFERIKNKSTYYELEEYDKGFVPPIGCYPTFENDKLINYKISIPYVKDIFTGIINVHELIHSIILDSRINNIYDEYCLDESLPMFYEKLFIIYLDNYEILKKYNYYLNKISSNFKDDHLNGFNKQDNLNSEYEEDNIVFIKKYSKLIKNR